MIISSSKEISIAFLHLLTNTLQSSHCTILRLSLSDNIVLSFKTNFMTVGGILLDVLNTIGHHDIFESLASVINGVPFNPKIVCVLTIEDTLINLYLTPSTDEYLVAT